MSENERNAEIERLEKEREELLKQLSPEERAEYEEFRLRFTEANQRRNDRPSSLPAQ